MSNVEYGRYYGYIVKPDEVFDNWIEQVKQLGFPFIVSPLHDKDKKEPHWHMIVDYSQIIYNRDKDNIIPLLNCSEVEIVNDVDKYIEYFQHLNQPNKHYYEDKPKCYNGFKVVRNYSLCRNMHLYGMFQIESHEIKKGIGNIWYIAVKVKDIRSNVIYNLVDENPARYDLYENGKTAMFYLNLSIDRYKTSITIIGIKYCNKENIIYPFKSNGMYLYGDFIVSDITVKNSRNGNKYVLLEVFDDKNYSYYHLMESDINRYDLYIKGVKLKFLLELKITKYRSSLIVLGVK